MQCVGRIRLQWAAGERELKRDVFAAGRPEIVERVLRNADHPHVTPAGFVVARRAPDPNVRDAKVRLTTCVWRRGASWASGSRAPRVRARGSVAPAPARAPR